MKFLFYCWILFTLNINVQAQENTCILAQYCKNNSTQSPCPDPTKVDHPIIWKRPPTKLTNIIAINAFKEICPYMTSTDLCCTDAQVSIMKANFATSDSVFGEVGMCGLNLKKLWCEYTCSPN